jgi:hypothetical protein
MNDALRRELGQAAIIARATFNGFLESDLVPSGMQAPALIWAAAFLVGPSLFFPAQYMAKYPYLRRYFPDKVEPALWNDRMLFILLSAGAMGIVAVVLWDTLFPARRDAFVLTPLPVRPPVQMLGRLGALLGLCVAFVTALNVVPAFTFSFVSAGRFAEIPRWMIGHLAATSTADVFVFFTVTSLQGLVILAFGRRAAARLGAGVQAIAVLALLLTLLFMSPIRDFTRDALLKGDGSSPALRYSPVAWFLALYESIAGTGRPVMHTLAGVGLLAAIVPTAVTAGVYALGYRRLLARAVEMPRVRPTTFVRRVVSRVVKVILIRRAEEQAVASFLLRAIARSGRHSMLMSIYVGAGLALIGTALLPHPTPVGILAMPLILSAALATGMRILMTIPADLGARWVFQTTALSVRRVDGAAEKAMLLVVLPPVLLLAAASAWIVWNRHIAVQHAVFCGALTLLLCELLLLGYRGAPLTRAYVPGRSRFHMLWPLYLSAFLTYTYSMAWFESDFGGGDGVWNAAIFFSAVAGVLWIVRKYRIGRVAEVPFEADVPDDETFKGFNLTEIYAAQAIATMSAGVSANSSSPRNSSGATLNPKP